MEQWIDLAVQNETCMTQPETCGAAGGAVSLWLKINDCPKNAGILSTANGSTNISQEGISIHCLDDQLRYL